MFCCFKFKCQKSLRISYRRKKFNSLIQIRNIYHKIRETIYFFYLLEYEIADFGLENQNHHFSLDESMFYHDINANKYGYWE